MLATFGVPRIVPVHANAGPFVRDKSHAGADELSAPPGANCYAGKIRTIEGKRVSMSFLQRLRRGFKRSIPVSASPEFQTTSMFTAEPIRPVEAVAVEITALSKAWLASLPPRVRPVELPGRHPRVVNQLALCWRDHELTERVLSSLILDQRGGRQGFATAVLTELMNLREFHADRKEGGDVEDPLWTDSSLAIVDR